MGRKIYNTVGFNAREYWDSMDVSTGLIATTVTAIMKIPARALVQTVLARQITKPKVAGDGELSFVIGDADDTDGFMIKQDLRILQNTVDKIFGNEGDEVGEYLRKHETYDQEFRTQPETQLNGKYFQNGTDLILSMVVGAAPEISGKLRIWVKVLELVDNSE
jgi:hypothetical protein